MDQRWLEIVFGVVMTIAVVAIVAFLIILAIRVGAR